MPGTLQVSGTKGFLKVINTVINIQLPLDFIFSEICVMLYGTINYFMSQYTLIEETRQHTAHSMKHRGTLSIIYLQTNNVEVCSN